MKIQSLATLLSATLLSVVVGHADAQTALIDWSTATTATNPDTNGKYWNSLGMAGIDIDLASTPLIFSDNTLSTWSVAVDNPADTGFGGNAINGPAGPAPFDQSFAVIDGIFNNDNAGTGALSTISFSGLLPDTIYDFSAIGGRQTNGVDGIINTIVGTGPGPISLLNTGTVLDFSIIADNTGNIAFTFADSSGGSNNFSNATFNALSISSNATTAGVPEPTSIALWLLLGAMGVVAYWRSRVARR